MQCRTFPKQSEFLVDAVTMKMIVTASLQSLHGQVGGIGINYGPSQRKRTPKINPSTQLLRSIWIPSPSPPSKYFKQRH